MWVILVSKYDQSYAKVKLTHVYIVYIVNYSQNLWNKKQQKRSPLIKKEHMYFKIIKKCETIDTKK